MGGAGERAKWIFQVLVALHIDLYLLQEVWDATPLRSAAPSQFRVSVGETMGQGTGFAIGWRRALQRTFRAHRVV